MKMAAEVRWLALFIIFLVASLTNGNTVHRKFEYKYSFKPPYLAQKDGSVPFWEYAGNAIASSDNVRVAPSLRSQKGAIWSKNPVDFEWWEVDLIFRISGRNRIGADGLAFWYTQSKGAYDGTVFGSSDKWNGLGIFFDSFDNDNKQNNPYIMAVLNDGTQSFDHPNDGGNQILAGCQRDFRNKPYRTRARIEYYRNTLKMYYHNGMTNNPEDYELCFHAENVVLPKGGYFGVSAATGGLADDHDVEHFLTTSLHETSQATQGQRVSQEEQLKINQEYEEYQKKAQQQKEDYRKDHPEAKQEKDEFEEWFESDRSREYHQILTSQSHMSDGLKELNKKVNEIISTQERAIALVTQLQVGGVQTTGGQPGQPMLIDTIRRQEVEAVLNNQNVILNTAHEIKSFIGDVNSKADTIINQQLRAPTAQVQPIGYDYQRLLSEIKDNMNTMKRDIALSTAKLVGREGGQTGDCPNVNCLTTTTFLVFLAIQVAIILGYHIYKDNREAQAKKFY